MSTDRRILESALLATRFQRGDAEAFDQIVRLWETPLFYYLRRLAATEADAWELLQETWLNAFRGIKTLRDPHALPAFLYRIARNAALSRRRRREFESEAYPELVVDEHAGDDLAAWENAEQVHHALDQLSLPQREVLTLFFLQDLSHEEIAELLGAPVGTVKSRIHYAKQALCQILLSGEKHDR